MTTKRPAVILAVLSIAGLLSPVIGCDESIDAGTNADGDGDADTDTDADADTDTDADGDADTDSDSDGDTDSETGMDPLDSPYYGAGPFAVEELSTTGMSPTDVLLFRPVDTAQAPYPTVLFQVGANAVGTTYIDIHSYDLFWEHVASYGFVVMVIENSSAAPSGAVFTEIHDWIVDSAGTAGHWMETYVDLSEFYVSGHSMGGVNATDLIVERPYQVAGILYLASYPNPGMLGLMAQDVSGYPGSVLFLCGNEDDTSVPLMGSTNEIALAAYNDSFGSEESKTFVMLKGVGHGGFGDYDNPEQPVGTLGREPVTASIRHYLLAWLLASAYGDTDAFDNLSLDSQQPTSTGAFATTMTSP